MATAAPPPIAATAAERQIQVHGNVDGSIVQGDHNVVVNGNHGTIVVERVQPKRTRRPVAGPPRPPDPFVGRRSELARLTAAIAARQPVTLSGGSGAGRTALMRAAANDPAAGLAGGVLRLDGVDDAGVALSLGDLAQRLHDAAWETVPLVKVTPESARSELGQVAALAIVDDVDPAGRRPRAAGRPAAGGRGRHRHPGCPGRRRPAGRAAGSAGPGRLDRAAVGAGRAGHADERRDGGRSRRSARCSPTGRRRSSSRGERWPRARSPRPWPRPTSARSPRVCRPPRRSLSNEPGAWLARPSIRMPVACWRPRPRCPAGRTIRGCCGGSSTTHRGSTPPRRPLPRSTC